MIDGLQFGAIASTKRARTLTRLCVQAKLANMLAYYIIPHLASCLNFDEMLLSPTSDPNAGSNAGGVCSSGAGNYCGGGGSSYGGGGDIA